MPISVSYYYYWGYLLFHNPQQSILGSHHQQIEVIKLTGLSQSRIFLPPTPRPSLWNKLLYSLDLLIDRPFNACLYLFIFSSWRPIILPESLSMLNQEKSVEKTETGSHSANNLLLFFADGATVVPSNNSHWLGTGNKLHPACPLCDGTETLWKWGVE